MNWMDISSPVGTLRLTGEGEFLTGMYFADGRYLPTHWGEEKETPVLTDTRRWLESYFCGAQPMWLPPLRPDGTAFQRSVWQLLQTIPYGETVTYGHIAKLLETQRGRRAAAQAVGQAVGRNPISILIPCHRVLGVGSALTGYGGGLWRKEYLLNLENISYTK